MSICRPKSTSSCCNGASVEQRAPIWRTAAQPQCNFGKSDVCWLRIYLAARPRLFGDVLAASADFDRPRLGLALRPRPMACAISRRC